MSNRSLFRTVAVLAVVTACSSDRPSPTQPPRDPGAVSFGKPGGGGGGGGTGGRTVLVATTAQIHAALTTALAGDTIVIATGTYTGAKSASGYSNAFFYSAQNGTASAKITLRSADASSPAILQGTANNTGYVFYLTGDHWEVRDVRFRTGSKGIMLDNASFNRLYRCEVSQTGEEAIHLRDGSSSNLVEECNIHDAGQVNPQYGEGLYVGSDQGKWSTYNASVDNNVLRGNVVGPGVTAEHVDIKEGTVGTIVELNTFRGTGISGANYADSFIDAKGNNSIIRNNTAYREGNAIIVDAFQVHRAVTGWGNNNEFRDNVVTLDVATPYVVNVASGSAIVCGNTRTPAGNMYRGVYTTC